MKLENKVSIVTGGAKGMGRDISLTLAREGADLVLASRDTSALEKVAKEARSLGRQVKSLAPMSLMTLRLLRWSTERCRSLAGVSTYW